MTMQEFLIESDTILTWASLHYKREKLSPCMQLWRDKSKHQKLCIDADKGEDRYL